MRILHYAKSTESSYVEWVKRFLEYREGVGVEGGPSSADARAFLTRLAMVDRVSASTQNQAFSVLLLFFREVLATDLTDMATTVRARQGRRLPSPRQGNRFSVV